MLSFGLFGRAEKSIQISSDAELDKCTATKWQKEIAGVEDWSSPRFIMIVPAIYK